MPPEVFEINPLKSWAAVAIAIASFSFSLYLISIAPPVLLPFAWAFSGTAFTGVSPQCSAQHVMHVGLGGPASSPVCYMAARGPPRRAEAAVHRPYLTAAHLQLC